MSNVTSFWSWTTKRQSGYHWQKCLDWAAATRLHRDSLSPDEELRHAERELTEGIAWSHCGDSLPSIEVQSGVTGQEGPVLAGSNSSRLYRQTCPERI